MSYKNALLNMRMLRSLPGRRTGLLLFALALACVLSLAGAGKHVVKKPAFTPGLETVELFDAIDQGLIDATVIAKNARESNLFLTNTTQRPLSVHLPKTFVAVHVVKQFFPLPPNAQNPQGQQANNNGNNSLNGNGQPVGGGVQNGRGNNNNPQGNSFFSIPPETVIQLPLATLCLAHGRPEPRARMPYRLVQTDEFTSDQSVRELLKLFAAGDVDPQAAQAAVWHLTDKMSWKELEAKELRQLGGLAPKAYFTAADVKKAKELVSKATERAKAAGTASAQPIRQ